MVKSFQDNFEIILPVTASDAAQNLKQHVTHIKEPTTVSRADLSVCGPPSPDRVIWESARYVVLKAVPSAPSIFPAT